MLKKKNSLNIVILKYFLILSLVIICILWLVQALFFNSLYRSQKINDLELVANKIKRPYQNKNLDTINNLAMERSVCIQILNSDFSTIYNSTYFGKGCLQTMDRSNNFQVDFIFSNKNKDTFEVINKELDTTTFVYAIKLDNNSYAFINANIKPIEGTVSLITKELVIITFLILILSFVLSYFIANHISNPIKEISSSANDLAKGNFNTSFNNDSNILELDELSNSLNYAKDELSKTEEYRRDLMANVSHDLKTPLTMIKAYAEMIVDLHSKDKKKQKEDVNTIVSETDRLTLLVNDILELSKTQSNIDTLEYSEFDLIELINNILNKYTYLEKDNYKFIFNHNEDSIIIKADKTKIEQVIYNLINNAINYTGDDNTVTINVTNTNDILVEIIDSGKGIKDEDLPYIWDRYYKNKKKHKRNLVGTGLGLSIVKNILELHKFEYGVKTKLNEGSTFYFKVKKY